MSDTVKNIIVSLFFGLVATMLSIWLHSDYLTKFLTDNLLLLLIAVLAIHATSVTVLIDKLGRIQQENPAVSFDSTRKEIRKSIVEQIVLIFGVLVLLICGSSEILKGYPVAMIIDRTLLAAALIYDIQILWDAVDGVFVLDSHYMKQNK